MDHPHNLLHVLDRIENDPNVLALAADHARHGIIRLGPITPQNLQDDYPDAAFYQQPAKATAITVSGKTVVSLQVDFTTNVIPGTIHVELTEEEILDAASDDLFLEASSEQ